MSTISFKVDYYEVNNPLIFIYKYVLKIMPK